MLYQCSFRVSACGRVASLQELEDVGFEYIQKAILNHPIQFFIGTKVGSQPLAIDGEAPKNRSPGSKPHIGNRGCLLWFFPQQVV
jgi:hypothetical protein